MKPGVVFPQNEIGGDPGAVRAYAEAVQALGYDHVMVYDHVIGADRSVHVGLNVGNTGPYGHESEFHEPMVLFGYLAGLTELELVTGILILPQRQTALVAKQAAQINLLSGGRFRLGVGAGWNWVEYEVLNEDFATRGRRMNEQIELLRHLWADHAIDFSGDFHQVRAAGINPIPDGRQIPIWIGGQSSAAYRRIGRLADGWFPQVGPGPDLQDALVQIADAARADNRDPSSIGMEGRVTAGPDNDQVHRDIDAWREIGASHLSVNTMGLGFASVDDHIAALGRAIAFL